MGSEKKKWENEHNQEVEEKIENAVLLAKTDWIENNKLMLQERNVEELREKCEQYELVVQDLQNKNKQQRGEFDVTLAGVRISIEKELEDKFDNKLQHLLKEEKKKLEVEKDRFTKEH